MLYKKPSTHEFQFIAGNLALDFVNTVGNRLGAQRDYLFDTAELRRWVRLAGFLDTQAPPTLSKTKLPLVRQVREELYALFRPLAMSRGVTRRALHELNSRLSRTIGKRQLCCSQETVVWIWRTSRDDPDRVLAPVLLSAANLLVSRFRNQIRQCEGESCGWLFLDRSKAGTRRWCSMTDCGNRVKVRRYYHKHLTTYSQATN
ncbi:MAG TPA: ABATE domain-containing protein [Blastocatellia bacterium]|nr:ABATE domain-containing protein [Blastocatellia bacterium]